ncbi:response regulator [Dyadobacter fanqingshengii]|uniref:Response regulator n=1 Tax=Dyadobacter fanqingshengii TaxID=2906443 RepID=A0A9X1PD02_9BACT|nr:response regulator [Dyadobacter fanqingshengii]MCF0042235.1 response regulator [Dyadobacter fanqingshengii]USJ35234.1 response regulator [Dyadobacter fanqingshengii]
MNKNGDIIIIEDDPDDRFMLEEVFTILDFPNPRKYFEDGAAALEYLENTTDLPFLILSDLNMPRLGGLELRKRLHTDARLNLRCIPYLFFSTSVDQNAVIDAYSMSAQGFFVKPVQFEDLKDTIKLIVNYWKKCAAPNNF